MDRLNNTKSSLITFNHRQMNGKGDTYRPTDIQMSHKEYKYIFRKGYLIPHDEKFKVIKK